MARVISVEAERFPIAGTFTISRGSKTEAEVITCTIGENGHVGRGECVPYRRYGETMEGVRTRSRRCATEIAGGIDRTACSTPCRRAPPATRIDCALWDLEAKISGNAGRDRDLRRRAASRSKRPTRCRWANRRRWRRRRRANAARPLLKVKIGGDGDIARIRAVRQAAPRQPHHPRRQ